MEVGGKSKSVGGDYVGSLRQGKQRTSRKTEEIKCQRRTSSNPVLMEMKTAAGGRKERAASHGGKKGQMTRVWRVHYVITDTSSNSLASFTSTEDTRCWVNCWVMSELIGYLENLNMLVFVIKRNEMVADKIKRN